MKTIKPIYFTVPAVIVIVLIAGAFMWSNYQFSTKTANASNDVVINGTSINSAQPNLASPNMVTANGITIEATNFRIEDGFFIADVCYDRPSEADWLLPANTTLFTGDRSINVFEWGLIDFKAGADGGPGQRCDFARFPLEADTEINDFEIVVPRLETSFPDNLDCDAAQQKLDSNGIVIRCVEGEGYYGPELVSKPENVSETDAYKLIGEAFIEIVEGPWTLKGSLQ